MHLGPPLGEGPVPDDRAPDPGQGLRELPIALRPLPHGFARDAQTPADLRVRYEVLGHLSTLPHVNQGASSRRRGCRGSPAAGAAGLTQYARGADLGFHDVR